MNNDQIKTLLDQVSVEDDRIAKALEKVGYPPERIRPKGLQTLLSAIIGQQVSVHAARAIQDRVFSLMDNNPTPAKILALPEEALKGAGLSRQKLIYVRSLAETINRGDLNLSKLDDASDEAAIKAITTVKGLGRWSAEMYLMFALGRPDVWPVDDLGVQEGVARMLSLKARPKPKVLSDIGARWSPARSAVALLAWHYYAKVPLE